MQPANSSGFALVFFLAAVIMAWAVLSGLDRSKELLESLWNLMGALELLAMASFMIDIRALRGGGGPIFRLPQAELTEAERALFGGRQLKPLGICMALSLIVPFIGHWLFRNDSGLIVSAAIIVAFMVYVRFRQWRDLGY